MPWGQESGSDMYSAFEIAVESHLDIGNEVEIRHDNQLCGRPLPGTCQAAAGITSAMTINQQVTVANLTQDTLSCYLEHKKIRIEGTASLASLAPFVSKTVVLSSAATCFRVILSKKDESEVHFDIRLRSKAWKMIRTAYNVPWRIYVVRVSSSVVFLSASRMTRFYRSP